MRRSREFSRRELIQMKGAALAIGETSWKAPSRANSVKFADVAERAGISFLHDNAASAKKYLIETMGAGCGWIDYDQNGLLDLYLVNSAATKAYQPKKPLRSALYRNNGDGTLRDVTEKAGVGAMAPLGMGAGGGD